MNPPKKPKSVFVKPQVKKHKAIAVIAGSGGSSACTYVAKIGCNCYYL